ncbi:Quino protein alcohol dehydrogenase-like protein, partial [Thozetella sp. PMI_491]
WGGWGGNTFNNRWAAGNTRVNSSSIGSIVEHCRLDYDFGVSATPVTSGNTVYYPTWNGSFVALDFVACKVQWQINVTDIIVQFAPLSEFQAPHLLLDPVSRTSPQIDGNVLFFGTMTHALVVAVDRCNGAVLATHQVNPHPIASVTQSLTVYNGHILVGCSSREESAITVTGYQCCSFIGNFQSLRFDPITNAFSVNWNLPTLPSTGGWSGVSVWGSQPSIDKVRNQVYIGTGNLYLYDSEWEHCVGQGSDCLPEDVRQDAIIALDITSGRVNWQARPDGIDGFTIACGVPPIFPRNATLCPNTPGSDANFGMAPAFIPAAVSGLGEDMLVAGQKNGMLYGFSPVNGAIVWSVLTSPPSPFGGLSWGVATDAERAYFTGMNSLSATFQLIPSGQTVNNSLFGASDLATGEILWETASPAGSTSLVPPSVVG